MDSENNQTQDAAVAEIRRNMERESSMFCPAGIRLSVCSHLTSNIIFLVLFPLSSIKTRGCSDLVLSGNNKGDGAGPCGAPALRAACLSVTQQTVNAPSAICSRSLWLGTRNQTGGLSWRQHPPPSEDLWFFCPKTLITKLRLGLFLISAHGFDRIKTSDGSSLLRFSDFYRNRKISKQTLKSSNDSVLSFSKCLSVFGMDFCPGEQL